MIITAFLAPSYNNFGVEILGRQFVNLLSGAPLLFIGNFLKVMPQGAYHHHQTHLDIPFHPHLQAEILTSELAGVLPSGHFFSSAERIFRVASVADFPLLKLVKHCVFERVLPHFLLR